MEKKKEKQDKKFDSRLFGKDFYETFTMREDKLKRISVFDEDFKHENK